jgi:glycosyltransferase involved in cell wall biosynthesis
MGVTLERTIGTDSQFIVALLGARMHYAVPKILSSAGMLAKFYTDSMAPRAGGVVDRTLKLVGPHSALIRRLRTRRPDGIELERITAFPEFGSQYAIRLRAARLTGRYREAFLWGGRKFNDLVVRESWNGASAVYVFNSAGLEILRTAQQKGLRRFIEQTIAPSAVEQKLLDVEYAAWPGWQSFAGNRDKAEAYADRERQEWELADTIVCGSEFVVDGIKQVGGRWDKCVVVPYGVDCPAAPARDLRPRTNLKVLYAGELGLRKGAPYFWQAASLLPKEHFEFRMVGHSRLSKSATRSISDRVTLVGAVPRSSMWEQYGWADVFVLPSICEGSATVTYEALGAGLPVIATRNAGTVVREGVDGFVVPARNSEAIAQKLELLRSDPALLRQLSQNARARATEYSVARYSERLLSVLGHDPAGNSN